ncbi:response regulator transcription factor [Chryseobacterium indologenes]|uniref:response regulator transcription factor n=1 Tax=Chryseobacterium indologenes TaxID=253 RepID=UPI0003E06D1A|nr:response regulator transcription factor [Chryseobacterium indologenes]QPQ51187.1 response regulator transcription factor [Chryseobacterium indologenes]GAE66775.1 hypothetical protein CIN01S_18_01020 [Chryseobacterium indologenes NBRC 14944]SFK01283.1 DNA-binding response regulator, NarL/FixJ family, contains REC and HTH domains [Chryseobacterium indologenes]SUX49574.1 Transcriptional regulatory protein devR (dosR) [Chryseobacterium indologenes]
MINSISESNVHVKNLHIQTAVIANSTFHRLGIVLSLKETEVYKETLDFMNFTNFENYIRKTDYKPDVVIIDIYKLGMCIYKIIKTLKKSYAEIRILIMSSCTNTLGITKMLEYGADGYITEDSSKEDLIIALDELLETGTFLPNNIKNAVLLHYRNAIKKNIFLTERDLEFLSYSTHELTHKEIAERMYVSPRTIDKIVKDLFYKTGHNSRTGLALFAASIGLFQENDMNI